MSRQPSESTPATNTRRRAADRRARAGSSSSVESDRFDATVMRRKESDSASYVRLHHRDSDPLRRTNSSLTDDATVLFPQPSNPEPLNSALSALLFQMKQLLSELASRDAAQSAEITAVSDSVNRLERSRSDRSDRESVNLQSVPLPALQPATVVVESRESRRDRPHAPRRCGPRSDEILRTTARAVCESFERVGLGPS